MILEAGQKMDWLEITINTKSDEIDRLCDKLDELGIGGVIIEDEAEYAASQIRRLVREEGLRYGEIAVLCRDQDQYRGVLDSVFKQHGVPVFTDKRTELPTKPLALFVRSALDIVGGDFTGDDVFTHIKTGLCDLDARQIGLLQRYHEIWNIAPAAWLRGGFTYHPDGFSDLQGDGVQARLAEINRARDAVFGPLIRLRESLHGAPAARCGPTKGAWAKRCRHWPSWPRPPRCPP